MAGPKISERYKYMTLPQAAERLGMNGSKLRRRLRDGIFPPPSFINEYGLKFFDEAQAILAKSFEREASNAQ